MSIHISNCGKALFSSFSHYLQIPTIQSTFTDYSTMAQKSTTVSSRNNSRSLWGMSQLDSFNPMPSLQQTGWAGRILTRLSNMTSNHLSKKTRDSTAPRHNKSLLTFLLLESDHSDFPDALSKWHSKNYPGSRADPAFIFPDGIAIEMGEPKHDKDAFEFWPGIYDPNNEVCAYVDRDEQVRIKSTVGTKKFVGNMGWTHGSLIEVSIGDVTEEKWKPGKEGTELNLCSGRWGMVKRA